MPSRALTLATSAAGAGLGYLILKDQDILPSGGPKTAPRLPSGRPILRMLIKWFRRQVKHVLGMLPRQLGSLFGLPDEPDWYHLSQFTGPMATAMTPVLTAYWDEAGQRAREHLSLDPDDWRVSDPNLRKAIWTQAHDFCEATNATTELSLRDAHRRLKEELTQGVLVEGEAIPDLVDRVRGVFTDAEEWRASRIAVTEASRAVHTAQYMSDVDSNVVAGYSVVLSADACQICQRIAKDAPQVKLGNSFAVIGNNPSYMNIKFPPFHPNCSCGVLQVLQPEFGGPTNLTWSNTLIQPKPLPEGELAPTAVGAA